MQDRTSEQSTIVRQPSGPDGPVQALLLDLAAQAHSRALGLMLAALEHLLEQQSWARERLARHAGRTILIVFDLPRVAGLPPPEIRATIDRDGLLTLADGQPSADAVLRLRPSVDAFFATLREGAQGLQQHLRIEGDVTLAATLGELAQHLRWDAEEDLSRVLGDVAAHRAAGIASRAAEGLREIGARAQSALARFAAGGSQVVVRPQLGQLSESASALDQRLRALEARAARLRDATPARQA